MPKTDKITEKNILSKINAISGYSFYSLDSTNGSGNNPLTYVFLFNSNNDLNLTSAELGYLIFNSNPNHINHWKMNALIVLLQFGSAVKISRDAIDFLIKNTDLAHFDKNNSSVLSLLIRKENPINLSSSQLDYVIDSYIAHTHLTVDLGNILSPLVDSWFSGKCPFSDVQVRRLLDRNPWVSKDEIGCYQISSSRAMPIIRPEVRTKINDFLDFFNVKIKINNDLSDNHNYKPISNKKI